MTPRQIIAARAPEIATEARLPDLIDLAKEQIGTAYGTQRDLAIALTVMHWVTLEAQGDAASSGPIVSEKEGDLSRTYAAPSTSEMGATIYSEELKRVKAAIGPSFFNRAMRP